MRVLLVHPDFQRRAASETVLREGFNPPALGINLLASILRARGHDVAVLDSLMVALRYGVGAMPSFEEEVARLVREVEPDVVGFNVTSPTRLIALRCARAAKTINGNVRIVFGGPHPTIVGSRLLQRHPETIDAAICGEGEVSFPQLLAAMNDEGATAQIPGAHWGGSDGGLPALLRNLDGFPPPDYAGYRSERYGHLLDTVPVMTARGCPYRCSFCYSKDFWSGRFRKRQLARVLEEIELGLRGLGCTKLHFNDDMFSLPLARGKAVLRGMLERDLRAKVYCTTRIDCLDEEFLSLFEQVGGGCIYFGIESGSRRIRDAMEKRLTDADIDRGMCLLRQHDSISVGFFLIFGYPDETAADIAATEELLARTRPDEVTCNIAHVHPGTALFATAAAQGRYRVADWLEEERDFFPFESDPERLARLHRLCRRVESKFGTPIARTGLIRDAGTVTAGDVTTGGDSTHSSSAVEQQDFCHQRATQEQARGPTTHLLPVLPGARGWRAP